MIKITSLIQFFFKFVHYDMKEAKGKPDMVDALNAIQQVIMKPEWKSLVQDVLENVDLTLKTQESVVGVANAIVTPLSLMIYAAELPEERVEECRILWKETLKALGGEPDAKEQSTQVDQCMEVETGDHFLKECFCLM